MNDTVKAFDELTIRDIVLWYWIDVSGLADEKPKYIRGKRRPLDESIMLCGGDAKRFMEYVECSSE